MPVREGEEESPFLAERRAKLRGGRSPRVPSQGGVAVGGWWLEEGLHWEPGTGTYTALQATQGNLDLLSYC